MENFPATDNCKYLRRNQCDLDVIFFTVHIINEPRGKMGQMEAQQQPFSSAKVYFLYDDIVYPLVEVLPGLSLNQSLKTHLAVLMAPHWTPLPASGS